MLILKHLKILQHVSIFIQIIFMELEGSLLESLNLKITEFKKFFKRSIVVMQQHNVWCMCVTFTSRTYTKRYAAASPQLTF